MPHHREKWLQIQKKAGFVSLLGILAVTISFSPLLICKILSMILGIGLAYLHGMMSPQIAKPLLFIVYGLCAYLLFIQAYPLNTAYAPNGTLGEILLQLSPFDMMAGYFTPMLYHWMFNISNLRYVVSQMRPIGVDEQSESNLIKDLAKQTRVKIDNLFIFDAKDDKQTPPNAMALGGGFIKSSLCIYSNLLKLNLTTDERKAIYAHEIGHIKHLDFLLQLSAMILLFVIGLIAFMSFHILMAAGIVITSSIVQAYMIQSSEHLADLYACKYIPAHHLKSALNKIHDHRIELKKNSRIKNMRILLIRILIRFKCKLNLCWHPRMDIRLKCLEKIQSNLGFQELYHSDDFCKGKILE